MRTHIECIEIVIQIWNEFHKEVLKIELLKLKLKEVLSVEDKLRVQYIQQLLDKE